MWLLCLFGLRFRGEGGELSGGTMHVLLIASAVVENGCRASQGSRHTTTWINFLPRLSLAVLGDVPGVLLHLQDGSRKRQQPGSLDLPLKRPVLPL